MSNEEDDDGELPTVHLSSDMMRVEAYGHETHIAYRLNTGPARSGKAAVLKVVCSCGAQFILSSLPKKGRQ